MTNQKLQTKLMSILSASCLLMPLAAHAGFQVDGVKYSNSILTAKGEGAAPGASVVLTAGSLSLSVSADREGKFKFANVVSGLNSCSITVSSGGKSVNKSLRGCGSTTASQTSTNTNTNTSSSPSSSGTSSGSTASSSSGSTSGSSSSSGSSGSTATSSSSIYSGIAPYSGILSSTGLPLPNVPTVIPAYSTGTSDVSHPMEIYPASYGDVGDGSQPINASMETPELFWAYLLTRSTTGVNELGLYFRAHINDPALDAAFLMSTGQYFNGSGHEIYHKVGNGTYQLMAQGSYRAWANGLYAETFSANRGRTTGVTAFNIQGSGKHCFKVRKYRPCANQSAREVFGPGTNFPNGVCTGTAHSYFSNEICVNIK